MRRRLEVEQHGRPTPAVALEVLGECVKNTRIVGVAHLETRPAVSRNAFGSHEPLQPIGTVRHNPHELEDVRVVHILRSCELDQERVAGGVKRGPIKRGIGSIGPVKAPIKAKVQKRFLEIAVQRQILAGRRVSGRDQSFGADVVPSLIGFGGPVISN